LCLDLLKKAGHMWVMGQVQAHLHAAIVVAAGRGHRAGGGIPKQYRLLHNEPVLPRSLRALCANTKIDHVICVIHPDDTALYQHAIDCLPASLRQKIMPPVSGGQTRQQSVFAGLKALATSQDKSPSIVLVHDAARPFVSDALIMRGLEAVALYDACIPAIAVTDTLKQIDGHNKVMATPDRSTLVAVQTPQIFNFSLLYEAHQHAQSIDGLTDDAMVVEHMGHAVHVFEGEARNIKLTTDDDFMRAQLAMASSMITVTGFGYDVHAFDKGDHVTLASVKIPYEKGIRAHSDGDVILHALCDALFGVMGDGDIGQHFPPSDPQWRGASSDHFLQFALDRFHQRGGQMLHADITLVAEAPRIGPHRKTMIETLSRLLQLPEQRIGLKATTSESMGFTGRKEGLAASVVVTVQLPEKDDLYV